ncbi:MAG: TIGR01244 family sulfur transferase [Brevundimonas sp.]
MQHHYSAIDDAVFVSGQLRPEHIAELRDQGFAWLVNHRPDGEEPGQPTSSEVAAAASAAGLSVVHAPVRGLPDDEAVRATARVLAGLKPGEKVLMFCRSGMRSSSAWAMVRAQEGVPADELRAKAAAAGYDLSRLPL